MNRRAAATAVLASVVLVASGCDSISRAFRANEPAAVPQPCAQVFNPIRCLAMTDKAAFQLQTTREDIAAIVVVPEPTPEVRDGVTILQTRSGGPPIDLIVTLADGTIHRTTLMCVGVNTEPACVDAPHLDAHSISLDGGYYDRTADATPMPSAAPDALAEATALRIDRLDIPIDHAGTNEVVLGEAWLPNGLVTAAGFALVDDWPSGVTILDGAVRLEVRSQSDGQPIQNIYEHGWRQGIEAVDAVLVFDVFRFEPRAKLSIADVIVR